MVDGKPVVIDPKEMDAFFSDIMPPIQKKKYSPREQALIIEGYRRGANKEDMAIKLRTSLKTMRRWYEAYCREHPE